MIPSPAQRVPASGGELLGEDPQQRRLAAAVGADDADPLTARDDELDVEQDRIVAVAGVDALEREHALAAARAAAQRERHLAPLEHRAVDLLHAVDLHLLHARLLGGALIDADVRPVAEAPHGLLEARDLLLLGYVHLPLALELELPRDDVGAVVARPHADLALVELGDLRDRRVEQVAVVADHHDRAVEVVQQRAEPLAARHVEVRLGLVEQQHVGRRARQAASATSLRWPPESSLVGICSVAPSIPSARRWPERLALGAVAAASVQRAERPLVVWRAPVIAVEIVGEAGSASRASAACSSLLEPMQLRPGGPTVVSASRSSPSTICGRNAVTSPRR